ncbi:MAG: hypothetical protein H7320_19635 [Ferruginibacter sp.]|nr:hypothetical protein [Ferruginibacter sp.]
MSIYLLVLSCIPCADGQDYNAKAGQKIIANTNHKDQQSTNETCTPFCNCSCCPASAFYQDIPVLSSISVSFSELKAVLYDDDFISYNLHSIWQPPKIG